MKSQNVAGLRWAGRAIATLLVTLPLAALPLLPAQANNSTTKVSYVMPKETLLRLTLSPNFTSTGERILSLALIRDGKVIKQIQAVSGKADVQYFRLGPASKAGSREPLPQGVYRVGAVDRGTGLPAAMGTTFIPVTPLFSTNRSGIGIHHDADRNVGGAGTIGCLGILDKNSTNTVADFVTTHRVTKLVVDYGLANP